MSTPISNVKHIVAVASGKGGVGKSTVSVNLALALRNLGLKVGLVDADVLGPSIPVMLGIPSGQQPKSVQQRIIPAARLGLQTISMGMLTHHDQPAIMRGAMVTKYMLLFMQQVAWDNLDVLVVDLPPGTGDIQLSLAQSVPLSGVLIVTTPQQAALNIARRGARMFEKVKVPLLGVVENMSGLACEHCGHVNHVFSQNGAAGLAQDLNLPLLGHIPMHAQLVQACDTGKPMVDAQPEHKVSRAFAALADKVRQALDSAVKAPLASFLWHVEDDAQGPAWRDDLVDEQSAQPARLLGLHAPDAQTISMLWADGRVDNLNMRDLRVACPCAMCVDEMSGKKTLDPNQVAMDVKTVTIKSVGRYALGVTFSDGHSTGIFAHERLRQLGDAQHQMQAQAMEV